MNELIAYVIDELRKQKGAKRRTGICTVLMDAPFIYAGFREQVFRAIDTLPILYDDLYRFPLTDEGDLERIKWLESLKQKDND